MCGAVGGLGVDCVHFDELLWLKTLILQYIDFFGEHMVIEK